MSGIYLDTSPRPRPSTSAVVAVSPNSSLLNKIANQPLNLSALHLPQVTSQQITQFKQIISQLNTGAGGASIQHYAGYRDFSAVTQRSAAVKSSRSVAQASSSSVNAQINGQLNSLGSSGSLATNALRKAGVINS